MKRIIFIFIFVFSILTSIILISGCDESTMNPMTPFHVVYKALCEDNNKFCLYGVRSLRDEGNYNINTIYFIDSTTHYDLNDVVELKKVNWK